MKKIVCLFFVLAPCLLVAQTNSEIPPTRHFLNMEVGGGFLTNRVVSSQNDLSNRWGGGALFELQYQYIPGRFGFGIGAQLSYLHSGITLPQGLELSYPAVTPSSLDVNFVLQKTYELEHTLMLEVPIQAFYVYPIAQDWKLNAGLGVSVALPVYGSYSLRSGRYYGNYSDGRIAVTNAWQENPDFKLLDKDLKGPIRYRLPNVGLQADLGFVYEASEQYALVFGIYGNYYFMNNVTPSSDVPYTELHQGAFNSSLVSSVHPCEAGVKVGIRFSLPDKRREAEILAIEEAAQREQARQDSIAKAQQEELEALEAARKAEQERKRQDSIRQVQLQREQEAREALQRELDSLTMYLERGATYFKHNSAALCTTEQTEEAVDYIKGYLDRHPDKVLVVTGHTCDLGESDYNQSMGLRRAQAYKKYCVKCGIAEERIQPESKGETEPAAPNVSIANRSLNRHIVLSIR